MPDLGTVICYLLVGLVFAGAARLYLRDARDRRAGRGDDAFAWRRDPNKIRPAAPKPVLQVLPRRWGWRHVMIAAVQVAAIGGGMWLVFVSSFADPGPVPALAYGATLLILIFATAFATFLLTWAWDLSRAALTGRRASARQGQQAVGEADRVLASRRRLGEGA